MLVRNETRLANHHFPVQHPKLPTPIPAPIPIPEPVKNFMPVCELCLNEPPVDTMEIDLLLAEIDHLPIPLAFLPIRCGNGARRRGLKKGVPTGSGIPLGQSRRSVKPTKRSLPSSWDTAQFLQQCGIWRTILKLIHRQRTTWERELGIGSSQGFVGRNCGPYGMRRNGGKLTGR